MKIKADQNRIISKGVFLRVFIVGLLLVLSGPLAAQDGGDNPPDCPDENGDYPYTDACGDPSCDPPNPDDECCDDGTIAGPGESCCDDISGSRTFGSITANFASTVSGNEVGGGYCAYSSSASLSFTTTAPYSVAVSVSGADVSWEENDSGDIRNVDISWTGTQNVGQIGLLTFDITEIDATDSSGTATFSLNVSGETTLDGGLIIQDGASGDMSYDLSSSSYDFSGISVELGLKAGDDDDMVAVTASADLDADGDLTIDYSANSSGSTPPSYSLGDVEVKVNTADINVTFSNNPSNDPITLNSGSLDVDVEFNGVADMDGTVNFSASVDSDSITLTGTSDATKHIEAFGGKLLGSMEIVLNVKDMSFTKITGSSISFEHNDLEDDTGGSNSFTGVDFEFTNGAITKFDVGSLNFVHKATQIQFAMTGASYDGSGGLTLDSVDMQFGNNFQFAVQSFVINKNGSSAPFSIGSMQVNIAQDPLRFSGSAIWEDTGFEVEADGSIGSGNRLIAFRGHLITNGPTADNDCNGLYVQAVFTVGAGIPIPYTPLKATSAGGEFGYNYTVAVENDGSISATKSCGTYLVGVTFGVSDTGGLIGTELRTAFAIGNNPSVTFAGDVSVPANATNAYVNGSISTQYQFWEQNVSATMTSSVMVPPGNGSVVSLISGPVNFDLFGATSSWRVDASNMTGTVWDTINLDGSVMIYGKLDPFDFQGRVDATLSYQANHSFEYPTGFDPTTCSSADSSDNAVGFGVKGDFVVDFSANASNLTISSNNSITGTVGVNLNSNGNLAIKWPCFVVCGYECVDDYSAGVSGNLNLAKTNSITRLYGTATVSYGNESETADLDLDLSAF